MEPQETFTLTDRRELIKQGLQLDQLVLDLHELKGFVKDEILGIQSDTKEKELRIRVIEDYKIQLKSQIMTSIWWLGVMFTVLNTGLGILIKIFWK